METVLTFLFALLFLNGWIAVGGVDHLKYKDPRQPLNVRVNDLLSRMTFAEKIGQMAQIARENATAEVMAERFIGSVLSGAGSVPAPKASVKLWVDMVNEIQKGALSTRLGIPMIYGIDAVHGHSNVYKATIFPHNVGLGATRFVFSSCCTKLLFYFLSMFCYMFMSTLLHHFCFTLCKIVHFCYLYYLW
ncbi:beta-glucosidase [Dendrobium catenatum]|uniref:Beta-glucosidase n=1 Tax=Dendrobium catenatum TaxID=906689 RepID=A0A2I0VDJ4_9ASPA|nr:beta-glucosidase [Dendrobium catenatum]